MVSPSLIILGATLRRCDILGTHIVPLGVWIGVHGSEVIGGVSTVAAIAGDWIANNANAMISFFMI